MTYLVTKTRASSLTIAGVDYTPNLVSWTVSDSSALTSGLVSTSGELVLGGLEGGPILRDHDRNNFQRGAEVILEITEPNGFAYRHPRGLLYVIGFIYDAESEQLAMQIGCRISLANLTDQPEVLLPYAPIPLDDTQKTIQGVAASLSTAGKYLFQDNQGNLVVNTFFDGDTKEGFNQPAGEWLSVIGLTAMSVQPLQGAGAIPDKVDLSYAQPSSYEGGASPIDIVTTESYYFLTYPVVFYTRTAPYGGQSLSAITGISSSSATGSTSAAALACGNTPAQPAASQQTASCNEGYELQQTPRILPAERVETSRTEYEGPAGQVSRVYTEVRGPALEANNQYYADLFAYCRYTWSSRCQPNGACSTDPGMENILLSYREQSNI